MTCQIIICYSFYRYISMFFFKSYTKVVKFAFTGAFSVFLNVILFYIFIDVFKINYSISTVFIWILVNFMSFNINKFWTFQQGLQKYPSQLFKYLCINSSTLLPNIALMYILVGQLKIHYAFASIIISLLFFIYTFFFHKKWSFT
jgi:putative flippase GtrA